MKGLLFLIMYTAQEKKFDVGGQAVMEGVMMRSPSATAVTVRRPDGTMVTKLTPFIPLKEKTNNEIADGNQNVQHQEKQDTD